MGGSGVGTDGVPGFPGTGGVGEPAGDDDDDVSGDLKNESELRIESWMWTGRMHCLHVNTSTSVGVDRVEGADGGVEGSVGTWLSVHDEDTFRGEDSGDELALFE